MRNTKKYILVFFLLISSLVLCSCEASEESVTGIMILVECCAEIGGEICGDEMLVSCSENLHEEELTEYVFLHPVSNWKKVKIELVKPNNSWGCGETEPYIVVAEITDNKAFMDEFDDLMCWNTANTEPTTVQYKKMIRITYPDGQCEIISVCRSRLDSDETATDPISFAFRVFDKQKFNEFWEKWASECAVEEQ
ncbi:MAG: hypothetical protein E7559_03715 [Ruminococcaceae bacterium]|nr:hypothetical protein [Oscillospiraceae bacterium]